MITLRREELEATHPNVQILALYRTKKAEFKEKDGHLRELECNLNRQKKEHDGLKSQRHDEFKEGFTLIAIHVK
jgi:hypothetical protein